MVTAGAARRVITGKRLTWCYLGMDVAARARLRRECGEDVAIGSAVTEIALRLKQPFLDWIAELGARQRRPQHWWSSALASKSPLQSDMFFLACYGETLALWTRTGAPAQVIVIEDPWLWSTAADWFGDCPDFKFAGPGGLARLADAARCRIRGVWAALAFVVWCVGAMVAARRAFPAARARGPAVDALIFTWIEPRSFAVDGSFTDAYTGRLADLLASQGRHVSRMTPLVVPRRLWSALRRSGERFLVAPALIRLGDIWRSGIGGFRIDEIGQHSVFQQRDHRRLLQRQRLLESAGLAFRQHQLWYRVARRVAATAAPGTMVVYPFENQPHEKLLCLAWRQEAPDARLVGYVTAGIPALLLSFFLGKEESRFQPLPDWIVTNGPASLDLLAAHGYSPDHLVDGGAFRFEHLSTVVASHRRQDGRSTRRVLVALSTVAPYSRALVDDLLQECRTPIVDSSGRVVEFVLTFHVDLPAERLLGARPLPPSVAVTTCSVNDLAPDSDLCLFAPPTGSWREVAILGLPVLRYEPDLLDIDPIDALTNVETARCSRATLRSAIVAALEHPTPIDAGVLLSRAYSPVREAVWGSL